MELTLDRSQQLSQQQLQNLNLLQMSAVELSAFVQELAMSNPLVEPDDILPAPDSDRDDQLLDRLRWLEENDRQNRFYQAVGEEELDPLARISVDGGLEETLFRFISRQLGPLRLDEEDRQTVCYLAACLDDNGYFTVSLDELALGSGIDQDRLARCLDILRTLEPAGVGAADLSQCLALQLERIHETGPALAIVREHLEQLARGRYKAIAAALGITVPQVQEAVHIIRELEPRPGAVFQRPEQTPYILPDVFVEEVDGRFTVYTRRGDRPVFQISGYYRDLLAHSEDREVREYLAGKLRQAETVLWAIGQREQTLLRCAQAIADRQGDFFRSGAGALVPLSMTEVAAALGVHESTVSRAVRGKYLQCSRGAYPLSFFFSRPATDAKGARVCSTAARAMLRRLVDSEDKTHPLSDQKLSERMLAEGFPISRRTVAKYREQLNIPDAAGRRA